MWSSQEQGSKQVEHIRRDEIREFPDGKSILIRLTVISTKRTN